MEHASQDITMHDKIEQPVHDTEMRYRALFENANDAIFLAEDDKFIECNSKTLEMFGCTTEQIVGKTLYDPYSPEFQPDGRKSKDKALEKIHLAMQGQHQFLEWRHLRYDGSAFDAEVSLNRLEISGKVFIQAIVRDISERKQLEGKLKMSEEKYKSLVEHVNEIIFMHDSDFTLTYVSPQCEKITGYTAQELIGQQWTSYATDNPINKQALNIFEEARETGKPPESHQVEIKKKDGDVIILEVNDSILRNANGGITGVVGSVRDITNQKLMEQALAESEKKFRTFFENEPEYCYMISPQGTILEANSAALGVLGYAKEELIGKPIESLYAPELYERVRQLLLQWKRTGEIRNEEMTIITRNGGRRTVLLSSAQVLGENGKPLHSISIQRDITERKKAQEELKQSEEIARAFLNATTDSGLLVDREGLVIDLNDRMARSLGRTRSDMIGTIIYDYLPPALAEKRKTKGLEVASKREPIRFEDQREDRWFENSVYPILDSKGEVGRFAIVSRDITEHKHMEEAYHSLVDNSLQGLAIVQDGRMVFLNKAFYSTTNYSKEDLLGASPEQLQSMVHPGDRELVWARHRDRLAGKPVPPRYECRWLRKDGSTCWVEIYASRIEYQGRPAIQTAYIDITERKKAEEALRTERDKAQKYLDVAGVMFVLIDKEGKVTLVNKKGCEILRYKESEIIGNNWFDTFLPEQNKEKIKEIFYQLMTKGIKPVEYFENPVLTKDGEERLIAWHNTILRDSLDNIIGTLSSGEDITERKKAEDALKSEKEFTETALNTQIDTFFVFEPITKKPVRWNKTFSEITGYSDEEIASMKAPDDWYGKDDLKKAAASIARVYEEGQATVEISLITKDGRLIPTEYKVSLIKDVEGNPKYFISIGRDITDRKKAQHKLLEYQMQLKSLASELLLAEESERRRIATGVHDDIGQKLALAKLELQSIQAIVSEPDVSASLGHACELIDKGIQDARSLAFDLSNPVLYEVGFVAAVESLLTERMMQKSGIKTEFKSKIHKLKLGQDMSIVLFQSVRELLTNVVKHANANKVKVCIDKSDKRVQVIVEDDGTGFEISKLRSPDRKKEGFGLFNVKERLEYLGGSFDIESKLGQGTRIIMAVPLESSVTASWKEMRE